MKKTKYIIITILIIALVLGWSFIFRLAFKPDTIFQNIVYSIQCILNGVAFGTVIYWIIIYKRIKRHKDE